MNTIVIIGRLVKDPSYREVNDKKLCNYTLASSRTRSKGADFIQCTSWGKNAEFARDYFRKGYRIAVEGTLRTDSFIRQDGQKVYSWNVEVATQEFAQTKAESELMEKDNTPEEEFEKIEEGVDEELPFN